MAELADALDLGSSEEIRAGSIPVKRTKEARLLPGLLCLSLFAAGGNQYLTFGNPSARTCHVGGNPGADAAPCASSQPLHIMAMAESSAPLEGK